MLKIDLIKFEAQDVITTSIAKTPVELGSSDSCICTDHYSIINCTHVVDGKKCGYTGKHNCQE